MGHWKLLKKCYVETAREIRRKIERGFLPGRHQTDKKQIWLPCHETGVYYKTTDISRSTAEKTAEIVVHPTSLQQPYELTT